MPAALPLWVLAYSLGIWAFAGLEVGWDMARVCLATALGGLLLGCLLDRAKGLALLLCALTVGGLAQARRPAVVEIPARAAAAGSAVAAGVADPPTLNDLLADVELSPDTQWLCAGRVLEPPIAIAAGAALRVELLALRRVDGPPLPASAAPLPMEEAPWLQLTPPAGIWVMIHGVPREPLLPDTPIRLVASLRSPRAAQNPGAPDRLRHAAAIGVQAIASVEPESIVPWLETPAAPTGYKFFYRSLWGSLGRRAAQLRGQLLGQIIGTAARGGPGPAADHASGQAVVAALALGERGLLMAVERERRDHGLPTIEASFRGAGIYHVLSVSGLHLAVVSWIFYHLLTWLLRRSPALIERLLPHRIAALAALFPIVFYALLTGAELATQRAAFAAVSCLLAIACGRRATVSQALAAAVLAIAFPYTGGAVTPPLLLCEPSLVLSIVATVAIAYLRPLGGLPRGLRERPSTGGSLRTGLHRLLAGAWRLTESSLAAMLATAPLCAWYFSQLQLAGVLGNLLPGLLGELVVLPLGLFGSLLGLAWPGAGQLVLLVAITAATWMVRSAAAIANLGGVATVPAPHPGLALAFWLGLGIVALGRRWGYLIGAAALLAYLIVWRLPTRELRVTVLDVGQGDAIVVELPAGGVMVVDAGLATASGVDMGSRVVVPFLRQRGYRRVDLVVATHPHPDHTGGLGALIESFPIGELWAVPLPSAERPARRGSTDPAWPRLLQRAGERGVVIAPPRSRRMQGVDIEVLAPCAPAVPSVSGECVVGAHPDWQHNDNSLVLRLRYGGRTVLLPGDIELAGELALLDSLPDERAARADLLKAPHHCSRTSSSESFVAAVRPQWVVCSVGAYNRYRFPHPEVTARYRAVGSRVLRSDADGAIEVRIDAAGTLQLGSQAQAARLFPPP